VVRSLSEAPRYASVISDILRNRVSAQYLPGGSPNYSPSMLGKRSSGIYYSTWVQ
jgi:lycopene epsilon-cyclase